MLGMSDGAEHLHYVLELPPDSPAFLHDVEAAVTFARNPLYAILHEACYADGGATRWSAERLLPPDFEAPHLFTGEHVYPWMFEDYGALAPLREAAELLAEREWPRLYDPDVLAANEVPVAAAIYVDDMYVERAFSEETAAWIRGAASLDHQRVRAQRPARRRRAHPRPADRPRPRPGLAPAASVCANPRFSVDRRDRLPRHIASRITGPPVAGERGTHGDPTNADRGGRIAETVRA